MEIDINLLYEPGYNYRKHPDQQIKNLAKSLETFGQRRTISVWPDGSGKYEVLAGNGITFAARVAGWKSLECTIAPQEWDATQRKAYAAADNQGGAEDDQLMLAQLLEEVNNDGRIQLEALGSSKEQLESLLESLAQAADSEWSEAFGSVPDGDKSPFQQMTFTLTNEQAEIVKGAIDRAKVLGPFGDTGNENSNGNALARICETYG